MTEVILCCNDQMRILFCDHLIVHNKQDEQTNVKFPVALELVTFDDGISDHLCLPFTPVTNSNGQHTRGVKFDNVVWPHWVARVASAEAPHEQEWENDETVCY